MLPNTGEQVLSALPIIGLIIILIAIGIFIYQKKKK
ncbi:MAG: LPXTG cell wall anchor domain-containing protein [Streptococcaceae bacterium]|jgi:LPXTG-motif cell wall-anchored protein|nr:LPXTG cell wall anchor domain-containing protein [Streptococcaceae bacterium]MCH4177934.1 LPXTG cell wall anchor domain-containing protein [Streptococcaceae bacterium]